MLSPISKFIKQRIKELDINIQTVATGTGVSRSYLSEIISGKKSPSAEICIALADYFGVSRLFIFNLMGWLSDSEKVEGLTEADKLLLMELAQNDRERFLEYVSIFASIGNDAEKDRMMRILRELQG